MVVGGGGGKRVGATRLKATSLRTYVVKDGMGWFFAAAKSGRDLPNISLEFSIFETKK